MTRARFFATAELPDESPFRVPLSTSDAQHATRVLRLNSGEELDVIVPSGAGWRVKVTGVAPGALYAERVEPLIREWEPDITLIQGVAKGEKMDAIMKQAVEVGACQIVPVLTARSVVRLNSGKRTEKGDRWRRLAASAAKQARRSTVPTVLDPMDFDAVVDLVSTFDAAVVLWEDDNGRFLPPVLRPIFEEGSVRLALVIGPEGGLSADEVARLTDAGAVTATLGPTILRTETAAVAALAIAVACAHEVRTDGR